MKQSFKCFLNILLSGLYQKPFDEYCEDWDALYESAKMHSVENIFYQAIKDRLDVPDTLKEKVKKHYLGNIYQQISQDYYSEQIFNALNKKNIPYMPLKGYALRKLYPNPELRTSCDVDFFYDVSRTEELSEIMQSEGFVEEKGGRNHSVWRREMITFEPHFYLLSDNKKFHRYYQDVWEKLKCESGSLYSFTDEDFYIFFMVHSAKHFTHGGFGIRTVLDIHIYNQAKTLNREYLLCEFEKLGLVQFVETIEKISRCWFEGETMDEKLECVSDYIIESGSYGVSLHRVMINNVKENSVTKSKFVYLIRTLFLPYPQMKRRYPILQKCPVLLPFYWIRRWFAVIFKRRKNIKKTVQTMQLITDKKVEKYSKILEIIQVPLD